MASPLLSRKSDKRKPGFTSQAPFTRLLSFRIRSYSWDMTLRRILLFGVALSVTLSSVQAAETPVDRPTAATGADSQPDNGGKQKLSQEELETKFKATLTDATMSGRWCSINKGKLGPEKEDKYTIVSISKIQ